MSSPATIFTVRAFKPFIYLYGRRCRSLVRFFEVSNSSLFGLDIIYEDLEKVQVIKDRLKKTYSRQKSYAYNRRRDLEFEIGYHVYLKISPMKEVMRFGKKGKLGTRYVGPYEDLQRVGKVDFEFKLPNELVSVHPVFLFPCSRNA